MRFSFLFVVIILSVSWEKAVAGSLDVQGLVELETRYFFQEPAHQGQSSGRPNLTATVMPEFHYTAENGKDRISLTAMFRRDDMDAQRSFNDIKEMYWLHIGDGWDLRVGIDRLFWGVTESRHLIDIVNQKDLTGDIAEEDLLGQPMVNFGWQTEAGDLNVLILPGFRQRRFPGADGRLRPAIPVEDDHEIFRGSASESHVDYAIRYFNIVGDFDIGLSWFRGVGREPSFALRSNPVTSGPVLIPVYEMIEQLGADIQLTRGAFLWKLEALKRWTRDDDFFAAVAGLEYTSYGVFDTRADLGLLIEYLYDQRPALTMPTPFDDDIYLGARLALNNLDNTSFLAGVIVDTASRERIFSLELETRIGNGWTVDLELRTFTGTIGDQFEFGISRDDYLAATFQYAF